MQGNARPSAREDLVFRQLDDEWVIFDPSTEEMHVLNLTASLVWSHCNGELTVDDIVKKVMEAYEGRADSAVLEDDVNEVIEKFRETGLLQ